MINIAIGPTGIAIPYPAKTPRRNGSITEMLPHSARQVAYYEIMSVLKLRAQSTDAFYLE